ncbi:MAG: type II toxin-antitoxin system prevent-host-death family antitoxin [Candidatus Omnitrophica bacterium]|nr:type II toxin-antitoxin system prevent-host-death family antitoxin [Candidatus Omnitrophota bacterium]
MKIIEKDQATGALSEYATEIGEGPVVITNHGKPVAALVSIENADLETISLSTNPQFLELIERSRESVREEGGISSEELRGRFE